MEHATYFLTSPQYEWLANNLPTPTTRTKHVIPNIELLGGIVFVLRTGCRWSDIPLSVCTHHYSTCWRRLNFWRKRAGIKASWQVVLKLLDRQGQIDLSLGSLDGTLVQSPSFKECTGYSGKHHRTGTNISVLTEKDGLPLADSMAKGNRHDITAAERTVKKLRIGIKRRLKELNADKGYDSRAFRRSLLKRGTTTNIPERQRKRQSRRQHGPHAHMDKTSFKFRTFVERTIAWLKSYHRLRYRYERKKCMFQAMVDMACLLICLRRTTI
jgi:transposase